MKDRREETERKEDITLKRLLLLLARSVKNIILVFFSPVTWNMNVPHRHLIFLHCYASLWERKPVILKDMVSAEMFARMHLKFLFDLVVIFQSI